MKTCTTCSHRNPDTAVTCENCGSPLDQYFGVPKTRLADPYKIDDLIEGDFITDKYRVVRTLGEGGMGLVYLVEEAELAEKYALKVILPHLVANPEALLRFKDEVTISRRLHHPAIIRVFDFGKWVVDRKDETLYYFTMEYLKGKTLAKLLRERENSLPPFKPADIRLVMKPLLDGLAYAHRFTIHRDIKPDNIIVSGEFPDVKIKILDFGIARTMGNSRLTRSRNGMGAAGYMAPEQMQDARSVDRRADLYGVGIILYEMLTNKRAVGRFKLPSELLPSAYRPLDQVIETALASEPDDRYPDAQTMANALDTALNACEQQLLVREQAKQEEEEHKKRLAAEEATKKALAEKEKRRKEEEKKQQDIKIPQVDPEELVKAGANNHEPSPTYTDPITGMEFVYIKGGCFQMGSNNGHSDEQPVHEVCVDDFYMGKYPVTQGEWKKIMESNIWKKIMGSNPSCSKIGDNYPVENVSWEDIQRYIKKLNQKAGSSYYRLPTEAEWEYAARAGTTTDFSWGNSESQAGKYAWYNENASDVGEKHAHAVGGKKPNPWGLYDMHGNVWEWCSDWYDGDYYASSPRDNPQGPSTGLSRVSRGGSWGNNAGDLRSAVRSYGPPGDRNDYLGFRLLRTPW